MIRLQEVASMRRYCEECGREVDTRIVSKREAYDVCGESVEVEAQVLVCGACGEEFYCEELDSEVLLRAYNEYRRRHKLLFPDEIRNIREQYGLSQRSFAKLLNWGDKTVRRYENGSVQDRAHNSLLLFLRDPENMKAYLLENEILLDERHKKKIYEAIERMELSRTAETEKKLRDLFFRKAPSIENGFKTFDYEKFCAMVLFFAHKSRTLLKVKLLKLLNYSDMIFYQENGVSMSGTEYVHLPFGPVPRNYDILFGLLAADHVAHIEILFEHGYERHQVVPDCRLADGSLSEQERTVLNRIYERFADFGSAEISDYSHREEGYRATKPGEVISYSYARNIHLE